VWEGVGGGGRYGGEGMAVVSEAGPEWAVAFFASVRAGAIVVPLDPKLAEEELKAVLADARPRLVFVSRRLAPLLLSLSAGVPPSDGGRLPDGPLAGSELGSVESLRGSFP